MRFYLVIIQNDTSQAIYPYEDYSAALAAFHNELGYRHETRISTTCVILNSQGELMRRERWDAPINKEEENEIQISE